MVGSGLVIREQTLRHHTYTEDSCTSGCGEQRGGWGGQTRGVSLFCLVKWTV